MVTSLATLLAPQTQRRSVFLPPTYPRQRVEGNTMSLEDCRGTWHSTTTHAVKDVSHTGLLRTRSRQCEDETSRVVGQFVLGPLPTDQLYHDHSSDPIYSAGKHLRRYRFPDRLFELLEEATEGSDGQCISWAPHGRCFCVDDPERFVQSVLPKYFKQSKITSFQRQLNLYGFRRFLSGPDRGSYYHELFLRGRPDLCRRIVRTRIKGKPNRQTSSTETEPNLYLYRPCVDASACSSMHRVPIIPRGPGGLFAPLPSSVTVISGGGGDSLQESDESRGNSTSTFDGNHSTRSHIFNGNGRGYHPDGDDDDGSSSEGSSIPDRDDLPPLDDAWDAVGEDLVDTWIVDNRIDPELLHLLAIGAHKIP